MELETKCIARRKLNYGEQLIRMEGIITEVHDGCVCIDLKGRLGALKIPMRMLVSDEPLKKGQEVAWNMSFVEQLALEASPDCLSGDWSVKTD